jgi:thiosulfate reductase cytochrome b subunit
MAEPVYILSPWVRIWHWAHTVLVLILAVTGASLHFASPSLPLVSFELSNTLHHIAGLGLAATWAMFLGGNILTGNGRHFRPHGADFGRRVWVQTRYYLWDIFSGAPQPYPPTPGNHHNALQVVVYSLVMYPLMAAVVFSGLLLIGPEIIAGFPLTGIIGRVGLAIVHFLAAFGLVLFVVCHMYLATTGRTVASLTRMIITGWHQ